MKGKVKFYNRKKGYGFIAADDGNEYFVHFTGIQQGVFLNENDAVVFEISEGERGPIAVNVTKDTNAPEEESNEESQDTSDEESTKEDQEEESNEESQDTSDEESTKEDQEEKPDE